MAVPWARVKDYLYILSALQTQTSKDHADQANVDYVFHVLRDVQVHVKQVNYHIISFIFIYFHMLKASRSC